MTDRKKRSEAKFGAVEQVLAAYRADVLPDRRTRMVRSFLEHASLRDDKEAIEILLYVLNEESSTEIRQMIVEYLAASRPSGALYLLVKTLFDPEPKIRSRAAEGLVGYGDRDLVSDYLVQFLDASTDPATRSPMEVVVRLITGVSLEKITGSQRERLRIGDHPRTIWREYYGETKRPAEHTPKQEPLNDPDAPGS